MTIASLETPEEKHIRLDLSHSRQPVQDVGVSLELDALSSAAGRNPLVQSSQMERQAEQLAVEFQQQQHDLDRREAEFNARAARMENELRVARLVYREREVSLQEKQSDFQQSIHQLQQHNADLVAAQQALEMEAEEFVQSRTEALDDARLSAESWQKKLRHVEHQEESLQHQLEDTQRQKEVLSDYRQKYEQKMVELRDRNEKLDRRMTAVDQLNDEATRMYREALEHRIATEELWAEMQPLASAAELSSRVSELRRRLDDNYQLTHQRLERRRQEVADLINRLEGHMNQLASERDEMQNWVDRRRCEIESQANRLLDRERELDAECADLRRQQADWKRQRTVLETEIERLETLLLSRPS